MSRPSISPQQLFRTFLFLLLTLCGSLSGSAWAQSISAGQSSYATTDKVTANWSATGLGTNAWVGVFTTSQANTDYGAQNTRWTYLPAKATSGTVTLGPLAAGTYEFRLFKDINYTVVARSATFTVGGGSSSGSTVASYDSASNVLTIPSLKLDGSTTVRNVRIRLDDLGAITLDDSSVTSYNFSTGDNSLTLPEIQIGNDKILRVKLRGLRFTLLGYDADTNNGGGTTNVTLDAKSAIARYAGSWQFTVKTSTGTGAGLGVSIPGYNLGGIPSINVGQTVTVTIGTDGRMSCAETGFDIRPEDNPQAGSPGQPGGIAVSGNESYLFYSKDSTRQISFNMKNGVPVKVNFTAIPVAVVEATR